MQEFLTCWDVVELYEEYIRATQPSKKAEHILNELRCAILRFLSPQLRLAGTPSGRKMTKAEVESAKAFLKTVGISVLLTARETLHLAFESQNVSIASRRVYGNRTNQFLSWGENQEWWSKSSSQARVEQQCCPVRENSYGPISNTPLTERRTKYMKYTLSQKDTPALLQKQLDDFYQFLTLPEWPLRVIKPILESSADAYIKDIRLMLGWFCRHKTPSVTLSELRLTHLIPLVTPEDLDHLDSRQQGRLWKQHKQILETWLCSYFGFLREVENAKSPDTRRNKLQALSQLTKFFYTSEVEGEADYDLIPLCKLLNNHLGKTRKEINEWVKNRHSVSDFEKKWPDTAEGETALSVVRTKIVEPLRIECRPRKSDGSFRKGSSIAQSYQYYLKWSLLADQPARRQQEYRSLRIALTCPVKRPSDVPQDGLCHPLPPPEVREKRGNGTIKDNYLYFTYTHKKKRYPQGVWVLDIQQYKTCKTHSAQSIVIPNRQFADGSSFYDYLEGYLYGIWMSGGYENRRVYDWWQPELKGRRGRWLTLGRAEFNPGDACCLPTGANSTVWSWGYVFLMPKIGIKPNGPAFASSFEKTAHRLMGKRIIPHTMRYIWATWAYQVELNDAQLRSLAYAMGHTVETLRQMYERCTPEEKRRPIEEAIEELLFFQPPKAESKPSATPHWESLLQQLQKLSPGDKKQLIAALTQ